MNWNDLIRELVTLVVVIDPVGTIPVYLFAVQSVPRALHRSFAIRAIVIATLVLLVFLAAGQVILETLGLRLGSFQIAGGIILFLFAMTMIFGDSKPNREIEEAGRDHLASAVFPLAMPSIASPGAMLAIVVLTDNHTEPLTDQIITAGLLILVLAFTLVLLLAASAIHRLIGNTGASVISRVMGIILATIAVDSVLGGLDAMGVLTVDATAEAPVFWMSPEQPVTWVDTAALA
ncbi:MarC family protein [Marinovum sp. 2_MG-2023]|uniref:MarC family protein n=1 Tax=unclassified Marinovum TaxID=2647166 RepID=UPI0026E2ACC9|nr:MULTISPECIES: MarC family protein [unclassified Marinovum]MDO6732702.1 MarC family protein [Marinovum sp. 2_MG-2023]MDO6781982.1 MarC family protein [Marinovum sp. 1_MG-2023]